MLPEKITHKLTSLDVDLLHMTFGGLNNLLKRIFDTVTGTSCFVSFEFVISFWFKNSFSPPLSSSGLYLKWRVNKLLIYLNSILRPFDFNFKSSCLKIKTHIDTTLYAIRVPILIMSISCSRSNNRQSNA